MKRIIYGLFLVNLGVVLGFWWYSSGSLFSGGFADVATAIGRVTALLAVYFILLQFVFIGRSVWIEQIFGLDKLTRIHHWNGFLSLFFIILHPIFVTIGYALSDNISFFAQFSKFLSNFQDVSGGLIGLIIFVAVVFFSFYIVRRKLKYEAWYFIHLATYAALIFAWGHQLSVGGDFLNSKIFTGYWYLIYALVFGGIIFWRFCRPLYLFSKHRFFVSRIEQETDSTYSFYISGRAIEKFKIKAGQFMILRFFSKNFFWQAHPFSLSFVPKNSELRVTVKKSGDFTSKLPVVRIGTKIIIDGPYGVFTEKLAGENKFLFIAGGIGITPIRSLIEKIIKDKKVSDVALLYGNRNRADVVFKDELEEFSSKFNFPLHYVMSDDKEFSGEQGKIDINRIKRLVKDFREREIYICGPKPMMLGLRDNLVKLGISPKRIHFELFAL